MINIELEPAVIVVLAQRARAHGLDLETYVCSLLEELAASLQAPEIESTPRRRAQAFRRWTEGFPNRRESPLPDRALSRESLHHRSNP